MAHEARPRSSAVLTEEGRAVLRRTWPAYARGIQEYFGRRLDDEEARTLAASLEGVLSATRRPRGRMRAPATKAGTVRIGDVR